VIADSWPFPVPAADAGRNLGAPRRPSVPGSPEVATRAGSLSKTKTEHGEPLSTNCGGPLFGQLAQGRKLLEPCRSLGLLCRNASSEPCRELPPRVAERTAVTIFAWARLC